MKPVHEPWTISRSNASLYGVGRLSPADTSVTNPYYDMIAQHPLAGASLGFYLPGSGSTMIANAIYLGVMVVEWKVRFTSIKPPNISRSLAAPVSEFYKSCVESDDQPQVSNTEADSKPKALPPSPLATHRS